MKRFYIIFLTILFTFLALFNPFSIKASGSLDSGMEKTIFAVLSDRFNLEKTIFESVKNQYLAIGCLSWGGGCRDEDGTPLYAQGGAAEVGGTMIASLVTTPPVQTKTYIADVIQNFGIAQPAYAQGLGFTSLTPVLNIWKAFRNIAYFIFVIIFVVIGFMIMFRAKIDPQTVVNIQTALPKLVVTLLLITFSYAIAGFIIDLIYFSIYLIAAILNTFNVFENTNLADLLLGQSLSKIYISNFLGWNETSGQAARAIAILISEHIGGGLGIALGGIGQVAAYVLIAIALLIAIFRTFFILLSSYVSIIVSVIFSPIQILFNALPGTNTFSSWLKNLIANAAVFPTVALLILIGVALLGQNNPNSANEFQVSPGVGFDAQSGELSGFSPPFIFPYGNSAATMQGVMGLIGLGFLMLIPNAAQMVKKTLQVESSGYGGAAMSGVFAGPKMVGGIVQTGLSLGSQAGYTGEFISRMTGKRGRGAPEKQRGEPVSNEHK